MSYTVSPQVTRAGAPGATDDATKGFAVGSMWVDTTPNPDVLYICTANTASAATWISAGGVTSHGALTNLGWTSSPGHTGTANSVACFSSTGTAQTAQATVDGTVLSFSGGVLQFVAMAAAVALTDGRSLQTQYLPPNGDIVATVDAQVVTGSFI